MRSVFVVFVIISLVMGCLDQNPTTKADTPSKRLNETVAQQTQLLSLSSLLGKKWDDVWKRLAAEGTIIVETRKTEDGASQHIIRNVEKRFGNVRLFVSKGVIDEVEAWATNRLKPFFSTVVGLIKPGVSVEGIENEHGRPTYVENGAHGLRMKGWTIEDHLVFVESNNGMFLTPTVGRVYAFHKDNLPSTDRMWSLKGKTTLQALMDGKAHIEKR